MRYLYLHGFASGPGSRKAQAFRAAMARRNLGLEIPDLAKGDFEHLTITGQLQVIDNCLHGDPARLIGSSMGGYLAALYAALHTTVDRLVLLAPAFGFAGKWEDPEWRETGWRDFYHHACGNTRRVHYGLVADALQYPAFPDAACATNVSHGIHDAVVPVAVSRIWAQGSPLVELTEYDSDHELLNVLDVITDRSLPFLAD